MALPVESVGDYLGATSERDLQGVWLPARAGAVVLVFSAPRSSMCAWASPLAFLDVGHQEGLGLPRAGTLPSTFSQAFAMAGSRGQVGWEDGSILLN